MIIHVLKICTLCMCLFSMYSVVAVATPSYQVFDESYDGWSSRPWGATVTTVTPPVTFRGSKAARVEFSAAMGVFKPVAVGNFDTTGYKHLTFAVYNESNADDLWLVAQNANGTLGTYLRVANYANIGSITQGRWAWVRIPIEHLGLGNAPTLSFFSIANGRSGAVAHFDDVAFAASSVLYEGINQKNTSDAPGVGRWLTNATTTTPSLSKGSYYIKITPKNSYGGQIELRQKVGDLRSADYGALAIRFRQTANFTDQHVSVRLLDSNGNVTGSIVYLDANYLSSLPPGTYVFGGGWYHVSVPLSDFGTIASRLSGVIIQTDTYYSFFIDDVRLLQKMRWVMPDVDKKVGGFPFGALWLNSYCSDYRKLHAGNDYSDFTNNGGGRKVYAASRGIVKQVNYQSGGWGYAVVIQHERGLTTSYLHLDAPQVKVDDRVWSGTLLGTTITLDTGAHLHLGIRVNDFDPYLSQVGALAEGSCNINGHTYPGFSSGNFIDSENIDW